MKSVYLFFLLLFAVLTVNTHAQSTFKKGEMVGQLGLGFGFAGIYGDTGFPPLTIGLQYGIEDKISVGGLVGYTSSSSDFFYGKWSYSYVVIAARGEYHFLDNPKTTNLDAYGGLTLGYAIVSSSFEESAAYVDYPFRTSTSGSYGVVGIHAGVRYYFNPNIAVVGELGYGIGYLTVGVAYRIQ